MKSMNAAQLRALDHGYTYGLRWLTGVVILSAGRRCSSATPRSRWLAPRPRKLSMPRNCSSSLKRCRNAIYEREIR